MSKNSDLALVRRMLGGDQSAFERFFDTAYPALYRFALVRVQFDHDAAGDIAQSAICKAIGKLPTYRGEAALLTWLCTFCRHELHDYGRQQGARLEVELLDDNPEVRAALESLHRSSPDDLDAAIDRMRIATLVQRVLDHLPTHYADALQWKYFDESSVQEIAVRLGVGPKAAESLLTRARHAFRDGFLAMSAANLGSDPQKG